MTPTHQIDGAKFGLRDVLAYPVLWLVILAKLLMYGGALLCIYIGGQWTAQFIKEHIE